jgi:two-component system OmpR family response regulator
MRLLVVEDEPRLAADLTAAFLTAGYAVDAAHDGAAADFRVETEHYDAVILDLGLPRIDGLTLLGRWRRTGKTMPVLLLTARDSWHEKVEGIDAGADDYVAKPFHVEEVIARVRALISLRVVIGLQAPRTRIDRDKAVS